MKTVSVAKFDIKANCFFRLTFYFFFYFVHGYPAPEKVRGH